MENLSEGDCCCCDGGKTKSTPNLGFRLRLEFDKNNFLSLVNAPQGDYPEAALPSGVHSSSLYFLESAEPRKWGQLLI